MRDNRNYHKKNQELVAGAIIATGLVAAVAWLIKEVIQLFN